MNTQQMIRQQEQAFAAKRAAATINGKPEPVVVSVQTLPSILEKAPDPTPRVEPVAPPKRPWDLRLQGWAWEVASRGVVRSFLLWGLGWYPKVRSFVHAVCSRRVTGDELRIRESQCKACDRQKTVGEKRYCGACGCLEWRMAELQTKNKMAGWVCPLGKHPPTGG